MEDCWNRLHKTDGTWTITAGDAPDFKLSNTGDYLEVVDGDYLEASDLDNTLCFETKPIDIRWQNNVNFSLKLLNKLKDLPTVTFNA